MSDQPITEADLARLEALCAAATEGPWEEIGADNYACSSVFFIAGPGEKFIMSTEGIEFAADVLTGPNEADVAFIAASRTALPALVAALRAAWRERDEARARAERAEADAANLLEIMRRMWALRDAESQSDLRQLSDAWRDLGAAVVDTALADPKGATK